MTSTDKSRQWAETLLIYLNEASKEFRYWDYTWSQVANLPDGEVIRRYGKTKAQLADRRMQALDKYLNHH